MYILPLPIETLPLIFVIAGLSLIIAEAVIPGSQFIVLGTALLLSGVLGFFEPSMGGSLLSLSLAVILFGIGAYLVFRTIGYGRAPASPVKETTDTPTIEGMDGRVITRVTPDKNGQVRIDGHPYTFSARPATHEEISPGARIIVTNRSVGRTLTVAELDDEDTSIANKVTRSRDRVGEEK